MCAPRYIAKVGLTLAAFLGTGSCSSYEVKTRSQSELQRGNNMLAELNKKLRKRKTKKSVPNIITETPEVTKPQAEQRTEGTPKGCDSEEWNEAPVTQTSIRERKSLPRGLPQPPPQGMFPMPENVPIPVEKKVSTREKKGFPRGLPPPMHSEAGVPQPKKAKGLPPPQRGPTTRPRSKAFRWNLQKGTNIVVNDKKLGLSITLKFLGWTIDQEGTQALMFLVNSENRTAVGSKKLACEFFQEETADTEDNGNEYYACFMPAKFVGSRENPEYEFSDEETRDYHFTKDIHMRFNAYTCPESDFCKIKSSQ